MSLTSGMTNVAYAIPSVLALHLAAPRAHFKMPHFERMAGALEEILVKPFEANMLEESDLTPPSP